MNTIPELIEDIRQGKMVILIDSEDRENEGDLIIAAQHITPEAVNFMVSEARGLVCLALSKKQVQQLGLQLMVCEDLNLSPHKTAFTVSIEAAQGVTTGISTADRAKTILVASDPQSTKKDITIPGHIFPIRAHDGGVLKRAGHTEASVDLATLAGLRPAAVICEIMNPDGSMARIMDLKAFAKKHKCKMGNIEDLIQYRIENENFVEEEEMVRAPLPTRYSEGSEMEAFRHQKSHQKEVKVLSHWKLGVVTSRFNKTVTSLLEKGAVHRFLELGGKLDQLTCVTVPGALEIPMASQWMFDSGCEAVVTLGTVIRGETSHYEVVCEGYLWGCLRLQEKLGKPITFGVLTVENKTQALARAGGEKGHKGMEAMEAAVEMLYLRHQLYS